ncbi:MAG: MFS transporter [Pseudomonadota bacterium]
MSIFKSLSREQKEAVGLLQIGTFLEYFDLMLYVHMAVVLNEIFFPKTDPHTASLIAAFAFCSTFVLRPFGALLFGYIGDRIGRKTTVIITTMMMSTSCIIMANLPTYAQIGIAAAWIVTICRIAQGVSSMGEIMAAKVYMTEITKPPVQYPAVSFIGVAGSVGSVAALGIATLVTTVGFNWRIAFWIGAGIALVGSIARTRLRETPEFVEQINTFRMKRKNNENKKINTEALLDENCKINDSRINKATMGAFSLINYGWPICFYLVYMYFNPILKNKFGYTSEDIIFHNFLLSLIQLARVIVISLLSYRIHPLKVLRFFGIVFFSFAVFFPYLLNSVTEWYHIFALQTIISIFTIGSVPADAILIKHFPVLRRVMLAGVLFSFAGAIAYIITSFGLVYLTEFFGHYGLLVITLPVALSYLWAVNHYAVLEGVPVLKISSMFCYSHEKTLAVNQTESQKIKNKE